VRVVWLQKKKRKKGINRSRVMWDGVAPPLSVSCLLPPARYIKTVYHQVQLYNNCTVVVVVIVVGHVTVVSTLDNSR
jgi:hypothetical protein